MKYSNGKPLDKSFGVLYDNYDKPIYVGLLINGKVEEGKNILKYDDNNNIDKREINFFKFNGNKSLYKNYICNELNIINDFINILNTLKYPVNVFSRTIFVSCYGVPGTTNLIRRLVDNEYYDYSPPQCSIDWKRMTYEYNNNGFKMEIFDTPSQPKFRSNNVDFSTKSGIGILIFIFNLLLEPEGLDESLINEIRTKINPKEKKLFYLVGNKCDNYDNDCDFCRDILFDHREKAKMLIDRGIINKYFEVSGKTGEGIYELLNILKIDSVALANLNFD